jgi:hypothetical protein
MWHVYVWNFLNHFPLPTQYRFTTLLAGKQGLFAHPVSFAGTKFLLLICKCFCQFGKCLYPFTKKYSVTQYVVVTRPVMANKWHTKKSVGHAKLFQKYFDKNNNYITNKLLIYVWVKMKFYIPTCRTAQIM